MATTENWLDWLSDAHTMETQGAKIYAAQAKRLHAFPDLEARYKRHVTETRRQAKRLRACLERNGRSLSLFQGANPTAMAFRMMQGASKIFVDDAAAKGLLLTYTFKHMEISAYRILIASAAAAEDSETRRVCEEILSEEQAMAAWLDTLLETPTLQGLLRRNHHRGR